MRRDETRSAEVSPQAPRSSPWGGTVSYGREIGGLAALQIVADSLQVWWGDGSPGGPVGLPTEVLVSFQTLLKVRQVHCETRHYPVILFIHTLCPFFTTARSTTQDLERAPQPTLRCEFKGKDSS